MINSLPFPSEEKPWSPDIPDGELYYWPHFLSPRKADRLFDRLNSKIPWQHEPVTVFGKSYLQPRLTSLHSSTDKTYTYSQLTLHPQPMTPDLVSVLEKIQSHYAHDFNTVLLNLYRNGQDSNGWHADNEKELGKHPIIASVSLGEARIFHLKHRQDTTQRLKLNLTHGSLLVMAGALQEHWLHQLPKTARAIGPRINLTFRKLI